MMSYIKDAMGEAPETLEEAISRSIEMISPAAFADDDHNDFASHLHHGFGQHVRNYWGLWSQDSGLYKELAGKFFLSHADDLCGLLLKAIYQTYHNLPLELEKEAAHYHEHWRQILLNEPMVVELAGNKVQINKS